MCSSGEEDGQMGENPQEISSAVGRTRGTPLVEKADKWARALRRSLQHTLHFCSVLIEYEAVRLYKLTGMTSLLHTSDSCSDLIGHFSSTVTKQLATKPHSWSVYTRYVYVRTCVRTYVYTILCRYCCGFPSSAIRIPFVS